jgi:hypothetical protein
MMANIVSCDGPMPLAEDLTLAEAVEQIVYGADCRDCKEVRRLDLAIMRDRLGADFRVGDLRPLLTCPICGGRRIIVATHWKSATTSERMTADWKEWD